MKNHFFKILRLPFFLIWIEPLTLSLLPKLNLRQLHLWFFVRDFVFLRMPLISVNLLSDSTWNTVVMYGLVRLAVYVDMLF